MATATKERSVRGVKGPAMSGAAIAESIERFLGREAIINGAKVPYRQIIRRSGDRQKAKGEIVSRSLAGSNYSLRVVSAGQPSLFAEISGLRVCCEHLGLMDESSVLIPWDEVIDEAIDADAGAETWEVAKPDGPPPPAAPSSSPQSPAPTPLTADVVLTEKGPVAAAGSKQVNGKPRKQSPRDAEPKSAAPAGEPEGRVPLPYRQISLAAIEANPFQPRLDFDMGEMAEFAESLRTHGLIQPIAVREDPRNNGDFQIIEGERRFRAAKILHWPTIACIVRPATDAEMMELALVANDDRKELNPIERAKAYRRMLSEQKITQAQLGDRLKRSQAFVANAIRLLDLPDEWQARVISREMSPSHARELLTIAKRPAILKEVTKTIERDIKNSDGAFPSLMEFREGISYAVRRVCKELDNERTWDAKLCRSVGTFKPTADELSRLDVIEVPGYDGETERFAANVKLFNKLQAKHVAANRKEHGDGPAKKGATNYDAMRVREREKQRAMELKQFRRTWVAWLVGREIAARPGDDPIFDRLVLLGLLGDSGGDQYHAQQAAEKRIAPKNCRAEDWRGAIAASVLNRPLPDVHRETLALLRGAFTFDLKKGPAGYVDGDLNDQLAEALGVKPDEFWQRELAGPLTDAFFALHSKEQLIELAGELGVHVDGSKGKETIVKQLKASAATKKKLPAVLAGGKPAAKSAKKKGRK